MADYRKLIQMLKNPSPLDESQDLSIDYGRQGRDQVQFPYSPMDEAGLDLAQPTELPLSPLLARIGQGNQPELPVDTGSTDIIQEPEIKKTPDVAPIAQPKVSQDLSSLISKFKEPSQETMPMEKDVDLDAAFKAKEDALFNANLARVLGKGASLMTGFDLTNEQAYKTLEEQGKLPLEKILTQKEQEKAKIQQMLSKLKLQQEQASNDPQSRASKQQAAMFVAAMPELAKRIGMENINNMSANDLQEMQKYAGLYQAQENIKLTRQDIASRKSQALDDKKEMKQLDFIDKEVNNIQKSKAYTNLEKIQTQHRNIEEILSKPITGTGDITALYSFIKTLDPDSAVREGEIAFAGKAMPIFKNLMNAQSRLTNNPRLLSDKYIKDIRDLMGLMGRSAEASYVNHVKSAQDRASNRGIGSDKLYLLDPAGVASKTSTQESSPIDSKIEAFMKANNISSKEEAIQILKRHGKLK